VTFLQYYLKGAVVILCFIVFSIVSHFGYTFTILQYDETFDGAY